MSSSTEDQHVVHVVHVVPVVSVVPVVPAVPVVPVVHLVPHLVLQMYYVTCGVTLKEINTIDIMSY